MPVSFGCFSRWSACLCVGLAGVLLSACQGSSPVFDTVDSAWSPPERNPQFAANFEYLKVEFDGRLAYMALGRREVVGTDVREYWYSGQREMLQLFNGRIEQVFGMSREVRQVSSERPNWLQVLAQPESVAWQRHLDLMPSYRYGVSESVITANSHRPRHAPTDVPVVAQWVVERVQRQEPNGRVSTYPQWFAMHEGRVVYSEQCLAADMCFKLKPLGGAGR